jgi:hypothetical protein
MRAGREDLAGRRRTQAPGPKTAPYRVTSRTIRRRIPERLIAATCRRHRGPRSNSPLAAGLAQLSLVPTGAVAGLVLPAPRLVHPELRTVNSAAWRSRGGKFQRPADGVSNNCVLRRLAARLDIRARASLGQNLTLLRGSQCVHTSGLHVSPDPLRSVAAAPVSE